MKRLFLFFLLIILTSLIQINLYPEKFELIDDFETLPWALYAYNSGSTKARQLAAKQKKPGLRFAKAVLTEYEKTITVLPGLP